MRVGLVTTFPPQRCGIGTYSQALAEALSTCPNTQIVVVAERPNGNGIATRQTALSGVEIIPSWARRERWEEQVVAACQSSNVDVAHIQHAPDIFGMDARVPAACEALAKAGIPAVVTLHTVYTRAAARIERRPLPERFHRALGETAAAIVVHQVEQAATTLEADGVPSGKIRVIPHGTAYMARVTPSAARCALGYSETDRVLLLFGFIHPQKNVHTPIRAMARLHRTHPHVRLHIVGSVQNPAWYNRAYVAGLRALIRAYGIRATTRLDVRFAEKEEIPNLYAAADLVLLPYWQLYGSASGVLHMALSAGKPMLVSDSPKFAELREVEGPDFFVPTHDADAWAEHIAALVDAPDRLQEATTRIEAHAAATAWPRVAAHTSALYAEL